MGVFRQGDRFRVRRGRAGGLQDRAGGLRKDVKPPQNGGMWVFGYGSLIWDPGFDVAEAVVGRVEGWHRSFCMRSVHYRGTAEAPGLVLALDEAAGAVCDGVALRAPAGEAEAVLAGLRARELISYAYREVEVPVRLRDGREVRAVAYAINRGHAQYCSLTAEAQAAIIARATGERGPNRDYLYATAAHLHDLGIADPDLDALVTRVQALSA
jgi:cation transport protein ChaC